MTRSSPKNKKPFRIPRIVFWSLFGLTTGLIIGESFTPSSASGKQSDFLSRILSIFINETMPTREVTKIGPTDISFSADARFVGENKAVVGTTKMVTYTLSFPKDSKSVLDSGVKLSSPVNPGEGSFTYTLTPSSNGKGAIRIIPLVEGEYEFALTDNYGLTKSFSFEAVNRLVPNDVVKTIDSPVSLKINEYAFAPYTLEYQEGEQSYDDHYLHRWFDPSLLQWSSSDSSIFTVDEYGCMKGIAEGEANLLCQGQVIKTIVVTSEVMAASAFTDFELTCPDPTVHPLDYDYYDDEEKYGAQIEAVFDDGNSHPVYWISENPLVALVSNEHYEKAGESYQEVTGGFVAGYRKAGTTTIKAISIENPALQKTIEFSCHSVPPSSFAISASSSGKTIDLTSANEFQAGTSLTVSGTFAPKNSMNQTLQILSSDSSIAAVANNNTASPTINFLKEGAVDIEISCPAIEGGEVFRYHFSVTPLPRIAENDMAEFTALIRKGIGHFSLFAVDGLFFAIALSFTLFLKKSWGFAANFGIAIPVGFAIGGISEWIQAIPALKRSSLFSDVLIDWLGFAAAAFLVAIVFMVIWLIRRRKQNRSTS